MNTGLLLAMTLLFANPGRGNTPCEGSLPISVDLETIDGRIINSSTLMNDGKILVLDFWMG